MFYYLEAICKLGLPMLVFSWVIYSWLYRTDRLDRTLGRKADAERLTAMKAEQKANRKNARRTGVKPDEDSFWLGKWMWFGGGFYGLTALWTLLVMEFQEAFNFALNFVSWWEQYEGSALSLLIQFFVSQLANVIAALVWFSYWGEGFSLLWVAVAWFGYLAGNEIARRYDFISFRNRLLQQIRGLV